jgi:hypothetical protein
MFVPYRKQTYGPPRPVTRTAQGVLRGQLYFLYTDDVRTSQETHLRASATCYCYSENLVAPGMEPGTFVSERRNSDHKTTEAVFTLPMSAENYNSLLISQFC